MLKVNQKYISQVNIEKIINLTQLKKNYFIFTFHLTFKTKISRFLSTTFVFKHFDSILKKFYFINITVK